MSGEHEDRSGPCDGTWAAWKIDGELTQAKIELGGILTETGAFNPGAFPALIRSKVLSEAIREPEEGEGKPRTGVAAVYIVIHSFQGAAGTAIIGEKLVAARSKVSLGAVQNAVQSITAVGLWKIIEMRGAGQFEHNKYDFRGASHKEIKGFKKKERTLLRDLAVLAREVRMPARFRVFVWVCERIILRQACATFSFDELVDGVGLGRPAVRAAIDELLADEVFVKVGEGAVSFPEAIGTMVHKVEGSLWTKLRSVPGKAGRKSSIIKGASISCDLPVTTHGGMFVTGYGEVVLTTRDTPVTRYGDVVTGYGDTFVTARGGGRNYALSSCSGSCSEDGVLAGAARRAPEYDDDVIPVERAGAREGSAALGDAGAFPAMLDDRSPPESARRVIAECVHDDEVHGRLVDHIQRDVGQAGLVAIVNEFRLFDLPFAEPEKAWSRAGVLGATQMVLHKLAKAYARGLGLSFLLEAVAARRCDAQIARHSWRGVGMVIEDALRANPSYDWMRTETHDNAQT